MGWKPGECGNPNGRRKGDQRLQLEQALRRMEKKTGKSFWEHVMEKALVEPAVMNALMRKLIPDLNAIDASIQSEPFRLILSNGHKSTKPDDSKPNRE
jgi:hypothetical protein